MEYTLVNRNYCFVSDKKNFQEVYHEIGNKLIDDNLVCKNFSDMVEDRENEFPTGIDLKPLFGEVINIAVPHTETEYVNTTLVVPIKLETPIIMKNMINPTEDLKVNFLLTILNDKPTEQANILALIMEGINNIGLPLIQMIEDAKTQDEVFNVTKKILGE